MAIFPEQRESCSESSSEALLGCGKSQLNTPFEVGIFGAGWHDLRLWEGRDSSGIRHALRKALERATVKSDLDEALVLMQW